MDRPNPYAPKPAGYDDRMAGVGKFGRRGKRKLASRISRFWALMIDGFIGVPFVVVAVLIMLFGGENGFFIGNIVGSIAGLLITLTQFSFLNQFSQTIGKRIMKIYIADFQTGMPASLGRVVGLRMFAWGLVAWFPVVAIIDIIFFFREDRRCLHDMFAGTVVYKT